MLSSKYQYESKTEMGDARMWWQYYLLMSSTANMLLQHASISTECWLFKVASMCDANPEHYDCKSRDYICFLANPINFLLAIKSASRILESSLFFASSSVHHAACFAVLVPATAGRAVSDLAREKNSSHRWNYRSPSLSIPGSRKARW